ncbi:pentatricopeptide repeat-containing protein At4g02750-like [Gastrolobium bilobum]|uniref:pentatricopeptide repeat-containing protein At4g02750-like n=1 Tax=Gastrolobium bilobum TaxID=150636 RepID=UPI002AAFB70E|nr:pentatricopeptide repeat-containing protein At4g02750-like [Gastrolobium bilobum]
MRALNRLLLRKPCSREMCTLTAAKLNYMLDGYIDDNKIEQAREVLNENPTTSRSVVSWNQMMTFYVQRHQIELAHELFDQMPLKDAVSWNIMLSGFQRTRNTYGLYHCFLQMGRAGIAPNEYTFSMLLRAVISTELDVLVKQVHARSLHLALNLNVFVGSSLIRAYASLREEEALGRVFNDILMKDVTSWNALVSGYMEVGNMADAQTRFDLMPQRNIISWTTLVNGYIRNKRINKARSIFNKMSERNVVSWTVMISGYVQNRRFMDALKLFLLMFKSGTRPNHFTFSSVLDACAGCSSLLMGMQVHLCIIKSGIPDDVISLTSLVDMYAKCGDVDTAFRVFESILSKNLVSWNTIIGGYATHGLATRALGEFDRMEKAGVTPDEVTFVNVLSACVHAGLVEEGEKHFAAMQAKYRIQAEMEHYTCMVDLYGRAGKFEAAEVLIKSMPFEPDVVLWGALLAACGLHSNLELGEYAAERIRKLESNHPVSYSMLSKIQGEKGIWSSVNELRDMMKKRQVKKQKAVSWELKNTLKEPERHRKKNKNKNMKHSCNIFMSPRLINSAGCTVDGKDLRDLQSRD